LCFWSRLSALGLAGALVCAGGECPTRRHTLEHQS
jgi:hypothetical protein